jgi:hypothetical protein
MRSEVTDRSATRPSRRNWEGAFPLLLIGGVLLVYALFLAASELPVRPPHLPLFGLVGGVGGVIAGAGIFSTFLDPDSEVDVAPREGWVTVPEAEWRRLHDVSAGAPESDRQEPSPGKSPAWAEGDLSGPSAGAGEPSPPPVVGPPLWTPAYWARNRPPTSAARSDLPAKAARVRPPTGVGRPHSPPLRSPNRELLDLLAEVEAMADARPPAAPPLRRPLSRDTSLACADCGNRAASVTPAERCSDCGRGLCIDCALASQLEDADLRCLQCRENRYRASRTSA